MRIAHVTDCYLPRLGGIEMQVHDLATRQQRAGQDVEIITATPTVPGRRLASSEQVRVHRLASGVDPIARSIVATLDVPNLLRSGAYDQVHVHASVMSPLATGAAVAARRMGLPTAITVHSMWSRLGPLPQLAVGSLGMRDAPVAWSAVSETAAQAVRRTLGPDSWVMVLPKRDRSLRLAGGAQLTTLRRGGDRKRDAAGATQAPVVTSAHAASRARADRA